MKRLFVLPLALFAVIVPSYAQPDKKLQSFASEFLPLKVGNRWTYQGVDPKEKIAVAVDRPETYKRRTSMPNGGERIDLIDSYVLRLTSGDKVQLEQMMVTEDGIYKVAAAGKEIVPPLKLLKLPVAKGDAWPINSQSENTSLKGEFVVSETTIDLPWAKGVKAILAKTRDFTVGDGPAAYKMEASYWFVPGVGIVKQQQTVKDRKLDLWMTLEDWNGKKAISAPTSAPPASNPLPTLPKLPPPDVK